MAAPVEHASSSGSSTRSPYVRGIVEFLLVAALVVLVVLVLVNLVDDNLDDVRTGKTFLSAAVLGS